MLVGFVMIKVLSLLPQSLLSNDCREARHSSLGCSNANNLFSVLSIVFPCNNRNKSAAADG